MSNRDSSKSWGLLTSHSVTPCQLFDCLTFNEHFIPEMVHAAHTASSRASNCEAPGLRALQVGMEARNKALHAALDDMLGWLMSGEQDQGGAEASRWFLFGLQQTAHSGWRLEAGSCIIIAVVPLSC